MVYEGDGDAGGGGGADDLSARAATCAGGDRRWWRRRRCGGDAGSGRRRGRRRPPARRSRMARAILGRGRRRRNPSNRDWLKAKGFKTLDDVAKSYREAEHAIRNGSKLVVPGDDAKPEEIAAFNKAIGVPEKPRIMRSAARRREGGRDDMDLLGTLKGPRSRRGSRPGLRGKLVNAVIQAQADSLTAEKVTEETRRAATSCSRNGARRRTPKWPTSTMRLRALGLKPKDVAAMQRGFRAEYGEPGTGRTLDLLQKPRRRHRRGCAARRRRAAAVRDHRRRGPGRDRPADQRQGVRREADRARIRKRSRGGTGSTPRSPPSATARRRRQRRVDGRLTMRWTLAPAAR
jgi:hypothetical protein